MVWNWMSCVCISKKHCPPFASRFSSSMESLLDLACKRTVLMVDLDQVVFTYCVCCDWIWPEVDEREVLFACQGNVDNLAARSLWNSWEGLFNLKFAPGCNMILKKSNMPIRMHRSAQVSGGSIVFLLKAGNLDLVGLLPLDVSSTPTHSKMGWRNLHFLSLT